MQIAFKNGLKKGLGLPGFAMGSAMIGFGALAFESGLDFLVAIASMLFLWSMPGMILFVTLISSGASLILMFTSIFLANVRTLFMVLSSFLTMKVNTEKTTFLRKLFLSVCSSKPTSRFSNMYHTKPRYKDTDQIQIQIYKAKPDTKIQR